MIFQSLVENGHKVIFFLNLQNIMADAKMAELVSELNAKKQQEKILCENLVHTTERMSLL